MENTYIAVNIEVSGPYPPTYSMLSLGACVVGDTETRFYREIQGLGIEYEEPAMRVACLGLECLKGKEELHPGRKEFEPLEALLELDINGTPPRKAMEDFRDWLYVIDPNPVFVAHPACFDWKFVDYYFRHFMGENPFGWRGIDMNSVYWGVTGDEYATISEFLPNGLTHNALEDAVAQAEAFEKVLALMKAKD